MAEAQLAIFLSPHFDDIALSCGGTAARLAKMGARCVGVTVFAAPAPADQPLSEFAQRLHGEWESAGGVREQAINDVRREEERQSMRIMGLQPIWLDFPDAPYRCGASGEHLYASDRGLFGKVVPEERRELVPRIVSEIRRISAESGGRGRVRVFAPLGIGHHVDHQLVFQAARRLGPRYGVLFYEDYPYVAREGALAARSSELDLPMEPRLAPISDLIGVKIAAIARYKSQLDVLFGSSEAMPAAVRAYAQSVAGTSGDMQLAERFWHIRPEYVLGA
jgi:LmbE family N-acetylglucosaminyl deacetylase